MKNFFQGFKKFISRGNIMDLAIGVIVGGAFTAIVTSLTNKIIRPFINWILSLGGDMGLSSAFTFLKKVYVVDTATGLPTETVDLANSIYIDWGAFIGSIIDFFVIAFTVYLIVRALMRSQDLMKNIAKEAKKGKLTRAQKKELKVQGIDRKDKEAVEKYFADKKAEEERVKAEEEEKARLKAEEEKKNSTEYLLKEIRDLLAENKQLKEQVKEKPVKETVSKKKPAKVKE